jgi:hypothetical protein
MTDAEYAALMRDADFCLCPTGDSPARATIWDALRRGCLPVLLSSCPHSS